MSASGLYSRFKERFSYNEKDGHIIGEIPLSSIDENCLLCKTNKANSDDHFPLRSMGNDGVWYYRNLHNLITDVPELKIGHAQGGITFKTLCTTCNSSLGRLFDPCLLSIYQQFIKKNGLARIEYKYDALIRCLAGHFIASSFSVSPDNPRIQEFRDIYNDGADCGYHIFIAPFSGTHSVVLNEMAYVDLTTNQASFLYAMKINPIAIIMTKSNISEPGFVRLERTKEKIRIDLDRNSDTFFPELYRGRNSSSIGALIGDTASKSIIGVRKIWTGSGKINRVKFEESLIAAKQ